MLYQAESLELRLLTFTTIGSEHTSGVRFSKLLRGGKESRFVRKFGLFDGHVFEFAGFEDLSAFEALNEFGVFFAGHDLHARMLARREVAFLLGGWGRRGWGHKSGYFGPVSKPPGFRRKLAVF